MKVLQILLFRTSLNFAMRTQDRIVKIVGQNFIAAAAVLQTRTMLQAQLQAFMNMAVSCLKSVWNVQL